MSTETTKRRVNPLLLLLLVPVGLYIFFRFGAGLWMDWFWFQELGYPQVFITVIQTRLALGIAVGLPLGAFLLVNALLAMRGSQFVVLQPRSGVIDLGEMSIPARLVRLAATVAAALFGLATGMSASAGWESVLLFLHAQPFERPDPILGYDVGFYIFRFPIYSAALGYATAAVGLSLAAVAGLYFLARQLSLKGTLSVSPRARRHLLLLLSLLLLLIALSSWFDVFTLMTSQSGLFAGPGYADVHTRIPLARASAALVALLSLFVAVAAFRRIPYAVASAVGLYVLILVVKLAYPSVVQKFVVAPNELARETPFILHNIRATREAFNVDKVDERELTGEKALSREDIENNSTTVKNIRLWDHGPLLDTFGQIQEIRTYYDFVSVDNDRYEIDGQLQQIMLSARELSSESLPTRNWINEHLSFTHGFGLTLGPVNRVTPEGLPVLLVKDIPPQSMVPGLRVERPQIYFGELTNGYVIANTRAGEFDFPSGEQNVYRDYDGSGGVPVRSFLHRLIFAAGLGSTDILFSSLITPESRVLYHRNLRERISRLAPYLRLDSDPYMVISEGKLYWVQDAYTVSDHYPYAQPVQNVGNYIRNSVKAVVDAYNGSTRFFIADPSDPILQTYARIFGGMFRPLEELPEDLRRHLRYPEDIFSIQTAVYSTYHMAQPQIFYNKEDQWEVPVLTQDQQIQAMRPYYTIMKLPGETREEFILMLPLSPRNKDNLAAWMAARSDAGAYGRLVVYLFPKQRLVYGPKQINARINQDPEISRQISLWDQRGSQVIQGTLLVIPVEEMLIYVRSVYIRAESGKIPELKRVVVAYENRIAMEETLEQSLAKIFGAGSGDTSRGQAVAVSSSTPSTAATSAPGERERLIGEATDSYDRAIRAQRDGNWAAYGEEIRRLGDLLRRLQN